MNNCYRVIHYIYILCHRVTPTYLHIYIYYVIVVYIICYPGHPHMFTYVYIYILSYRVTHTYTHLIRNILPNYWCGVHRSCTNNSVNLPGKLYRRFEVRNLSEVLLRLSSDAAQTSDCENRTVSRIKNSF